MWNRKELKAKGKAAYKANRATCIVAALLIFIVSGGSGSVGSTLGTRLGSNDLNRNDQKSYIEDYGYDDDGSYDEDPSEGDTYYDIEYYDEEEPVAGFGSRFAAPAVAVAGLIIAFIVLAVGGALAIFLLNPVHVGLRKFFVDNSSNPKTGLDKSTIGLAFGENYMNVVGSVFTTGLFTLLWSLLLIIPGIYKSYCWRLVPYIIGDDPTISGKEARKRSTQMMKGSKFDSFVLDLSFIGWYILGILTLGILNLLFTSPYQAATDAELYLTLSGRNTETENELYSTVVPIGTETVNTNDLVEFCTEDEADE